MSTPFIQQRSDPIEVLFVGEEALVKELGLDRREYGELNFHIQKDGDFDETSHDTDYECALISDVDTVTDMKMERLKHDLGIPFIGILSSYEEIDNIPDLLDDIISQEEVSKRPFMLEKRIQNVVKLSRVVEGTDSVLSRITDGFMSVDDQGRIEYINDEFLRWLNRDREEMLGSYIFDTFSDAIGTKFEDNYKKAVTTGEPVYVEEYYEPLEGWFAVKGYPSESGVTIYFEDITERKKRKRKMAQVLEKQKATTDLLRMVLEEEDVLELEHRTVEYLSDVMKAEYSRIMRYDDVTERLVLSSQNNMGISSITENSLDLSSSSIETRAYRNFENIIVNDYDCSDIDKTYLTDFLGVGSSISAPIGKLGDVYGTTTVFSRSSGNFDSEDKQFLEGVANILASAVDYQEKRKEFELYKVVLNSVDYPVLLLNSQNEVILTNSRFETASNECLTEFDTQTQKTLGELDLEGTGKKFDPESLNKEMKEKTDMSMIRLPDGTKGKLLTLASK